MWRSGRATESKSENLGSHPGDVAFETNQFCRTSSTIREEYTPPPPQLLLQIFIGQSHPADRGNV